MKSPIGYLLFFLSVALLFALLYIGIYLHVSYYSSPRSASSADVAIVLGAKSFKGNSYNPCLISRVKEGVLALQDKKVGKIIMTGGDDLEDNINEAETMQKIALEHGITSENIILETKATSTYENLIFSKQIMEQNNLKRAIIISEPFHIARARLIARSIGIDAQYIAAEDSPCWTQWRYLSRYILKEPFAIIAYIITGKVKIFAL